MPWQPYMLCGEERPRNVSALPCRIAFFGWTPRLEYWTNGNSPSRNALDGFEGELLRETCAALRRDGAGLLQRLHALQAIPVMTHYVLRDIWSQHVLFTDACNWRHRLWRRED